MIGVAEQLDWIATVVCTSGCVAAVYVIVAVMLVVVAGIDSAGTRICAVVSIALLKSYSGGGGSGD